MIAQLVISPDGSGHDGYVRDVGRVGHGGHGGIDALLDKLGAHMSVEDRTWSSVIAEDAKGAALGFASAKSRLKSSDSTSRIALRHRAYSPTVFAGPVIISPSKSL